MQNLNYILISKITSKTKLIQDNLERRLRNRHLPKSLVYTLPPILSLASNITKSFTPLCDSLEAAAMPAAPAPTITILVSFGIPRALDDCTAPKHSFTAPLTECLWVLSERNVILNELELAQADNLL